MTVITQVSGLFQIIQCHHARFHSAIFNSLTWLRLRTCSHLRRLLPKLALLSCWRFSIFFRLLFALLIWHLASGWATRFKAQEGWALLIETETPAPTNSVRSPCNAACLFPFLGYHDCAYSLCTRRKRTPEFHQIPRFPPRTHTKPLFWRIKAFLDRFKAFLGHAKLDFLGVNLSDFR